MIEYIKNDITEVEADIIVNASNGIGFMGGTLCKYLKFRGVAESIQYKTKGKVERAAKRCCKRKWFIPRFLYGYAAGNIFVTDAYNLKAKYIIHAVTMRFPGTVTSYWTIERLLPQIIGEARMRDCHSIAIPLLGAGTGQCKPEIVLHIYEKQFKDIEDLTIKIVTL